MRSTTPTEAFLLDGYNADKVGTFEGELHPMYQALPKSAQGQLGPSQFDISSQIFRPQVWMVCQRLGPMTQDGQLFWEGMHNFVPTYTLQFMDQRVQGRGGELESWQCSRRNCRISSARRDLEACEKVDRRLELARHEASLKQSSTRQPVLTSPG